MTRIATILALLAGAVLQAGQAQAATTYYVSPTGNDSNPGTQSAPWRTFYKAASTLRAGDTAIFEDGTYIETQYRAYSAFANSGTASAPITVKSRNKWGATLIFQNVSNRNAIWILGNDNITIDGFIMTKPSMGSSYDDGLIRCWESNGDGADNCRIINNLFRNAFEPVKGTVGRGIVIEGNRFEGGQVGVGLLAANEPIIRNNEFIDFRQDAIQTKGGTRSAIIAGNVVRLTGTNRASAGIYVGGGSCETCGIYDVNGYEGYGSVAFNNIVVGESAGAFTFGGIVLQGCDRCGAYHNVIINAATGFWAVASGPWAGRLVPTTSPIFQNNVVYGCSKGVQTSDVVGQVVINFNNFSQCSSVPTQTNPVTGNPRFVDLLRDWRPQAGSPLINAGTTVSHRNATNALVDLSRDRSGAARVPAWDVGAYEYASVSATSTPSPTSPTGTAPSTTPPPQTATPASASTSSPTPTSASSGRPPGAATPAPPNRNRFGSNPVHLPLVQAQRSLE